MVALRRDAACQLVTEMRLNGDFKESISVSEKSSIRIQTGVRYTRLTSLLELQNSTNDTDHLQSVGGQQA